MAIGVRPDRRRRGARAGWWSAALLSLWLIGCGRIVAQKATEQLLASDAVDRSIAQVDFRMFTGKKLFLDTQYINKTVPGVGYVTSEYIVSAVRQKMMSDGCLLQDKSDESDFVVEMRIGALGADGHEVIYGMPSNNFLGLAASVVPTAPPAAQTLPTVPEISLAKKNDQMAAAKIGLFAYNRRTKEPVWQSGISEARSTVDDRWILGAGPFHKGNIHSPKKRVESEPSFFGSAADVEEPTKEDYFVERRFADPNKSLAASQEAAAKKDVPVVSTPAASPTDGRAKTAGTDVVKQSAPAATDAKPKQADHPAEPASKVKDDKPTAAKATEPAGGTGAADAKGAPAADRSMSSAVEPGTNRLFD